MDRLRVKPIVKVTGEFWAQLTEGDGNFNMFTFLEGEGAHVLVDSVGNWVMYLMHQAKANARDRKGLDAPYPQAAWWDWKQLLKNEWHFRKKWMLTHLRGPDLGSPVCARGLQGWGMWQSTTPAEGDGRTGSSVLSLPGAGWRRSPEVGRMCTTRFIISVIWCWR